MQQKAVAQEPSDDTQEAIPDSGTGSRRNRELRLTQIIVAARQTFQEDGYAGFATRRVAGRVGITLGNLQYYFRTKDELLQAALHARISQIVSDYTGIANEQGISATRRCAALVERVFHDINETDLPKFLIEIWAFAQHDPYAAKLVGDMYSEYRAIFAKLLSELHPTLTPEQSLARASALISQTTGMMIFINHGGESDKDHSEFVRVTRRAIKMLVGSAPEALENDLSHDRPAHAKTHAHVGIFDAEKPVRNGLFELSVRNPGHDALYYRATAQGKRREVKVNEIVSATANILAAEGYANCTLARVSKELGIRPSALQNYFPTHDDLLRSTIDALLTAYLDRYADMGKPSGKPALERLSEIVDDGLEEARDSKACRFAFEMGALAQHSDITLELVRRLYAASRAIFQDLVREMDASATARECHARATLIAAQMEGAMTLMFASQVQVPDVDRVFDLLKVMAIRIANGKLAAKEAA
ncbi:TetR/AcrR family transcriptional regulator [Burkholderia aenigmatica]|uniref:TetR/AcrR family transcriptional regulator n=1 Tax=Burkholderia aenigmatica TaxID=2015348 RepID=UPI0015C608DB|nr:TetR/AcrR family transcriptional regulator [Burkholderia aenigmatica]